MTPLDPDGSAPTPPASGEPPSAASASSSGATGAFGATDIFQTLPAAAPSSSDNLSDLLQFLSPPPGSAPIAPIEGANASSHANATAPFVEKDSASRFVAASNPPGSAPVPASPAFSAPQPDPVPTLASPEEALPTTAGPQSPATLPAAPVVHAVKFHTPGSGDLGVTDPLHRLLRSVPPRSVPPPPAAAPPSAPAPLDFTQLLSALTPEQIAAAQATVPQPLAAVEQPQRRVSGSPTLEPSAGNRTAIFPVFSSPASAAASASFTQLFKQLDANDLAKALQTPSAPLMAPSPAASAAPFPGLAVPTEITTAPEPQPAAFPPPTFRGAERAQAQHPPAQPFQAEPTAEASRLSHRELPADLAPDPAPAPAPAAPTPAEFSSVAPPLVANNPFLPLPSSSTVSPRSSADSFTQLFQALEAHTQAPATQRPFPPVPVVAIASPATVPSSASFQGTHLASSPNSADSPSIPPSASFTQVFDTLQGTSPTAPPRAPDTLNDPMPAPSLISEQNIAATHASFDPANTVDDPAHPAAPDPVQAASRASQATPETMHPGATPPAPLQPNQTESPAPDTFQIAAQTASRTASQTASPQSATNAVSGAESFTQLFSALGAGPRAAATQADPFPPLASTPGYPGNTLYANPAASTGNPPQHLRHPFPANMAAAEPFASHPHADQGSSGGLTQLLRVLEGPSSQNTSQSSTFPEAIPGLHTESSSAALPPAFPGTPMFPSSPNPASANQVSTNPAPTNLAPTSPVSTNRAQPSSFFDTVQPLPFRQTKQPSAFSTAAQPSLSSGFGAFSDAPLDPLGPEAARPGQTPFAAPTSHAAPAAHAAHGPFDSVADVGATVAFRPPTFPSAAPAVPAPATGPGEFTRILQASALRESGIGSTPAAQLPLSSAPPQPPPAAPAGAGVTPLPPWSMPPVPHMPHLNSSGAGMSPVLLPHTPHLPHAPAFHLPAANPSAPTPATTPAAKSSILPIFLIAVIVLLIAVLVAVLLLKH